jgi:hypothetical protein
MTTANDLVVRRALEPQIPLGGSILRRLVKTLKPSARGEYEITDLNNL